MIKISDAMAWIEDEKVIALRSVTREGEPAALDPDQARRLARALEDLAEALESLQRERGTK